MTQNQWSYCLFMIGIVSFLAPNLINIANVIAAKLNFPYSIPIADLLIVIVVLTVAYILYPLFSDEEEY